MKIVCHSESGSFFFKRMRFFYNILLPVFTVLLCTGIYQFDYFEDNSIVFFGFSLVFIFLLKPILFNSYLEFNEYELKVKKDFNKYDSLNYESIKNISFDEEKYVFAIGYCTEVTIESKACDDLRIYFTRSFLTSKNEKIYKLISYLNYNKNSQDIKFEGCYEYFL